MAGKVIGGAVGIDTGKDRCPGLPGTGIRLGDARTSRFDIQIGVGRGVDEAVQLVASEVPVPLLRRPLPP